MLSSTFRGKSFVPALACLLLFFVAAGPGHTASLQVDSSAAFVSAYGLRVTPGCGHPFSLVITAPPVPSSPNEVAACTTITASGVEIIPPGSIFRAGEGVILGDLFRVGGGAPFSSILDATLLPFAWVQDNSPASETSYKARFFLDLDDMNLDEGDRLEHFVGHSSNGVDQLRVVLKRNALLSENRLVLEARKDGGGYLSTSTLNEELLLEPGWNEIRVEWKAADAGQDNGYFRAEVRNVGSGSVSTVDLSCVQDAGRPCLVNRTSRVDLVRWGVVDGILLATSGSLKQDSFISWK
jgi:hypothetical protein